MFSQDLIAIWYLFSQFCLKISKASLAALSLLARTTQRRVTTMLPVMTPPPTFSLNAPAINAEMISQCGTPGCNLPIYLHAHQRHQRQSAKSIPPQSFQSASHLPLAIVLRVLIAMPNAPRNQTRSDKLKNGQPSTPFTTAPKV